MSWRGFRAEAPGRTILEVPRLDVEGPGLILLLGATGSGKSTLLRVATGVAPSLLGLSTSGSFETDAERVGFVPQDALDGFLSFDPEHELTLRLKAAGGGLADARERAAQGLRRLGLHEHATQPIHHLSAGERRRLLIHAVQVHDPSVLLLDEPFNHVDHAWRRRIMEDLQAAARERLVLVATHEARPWLGTRVRTVALRAGRPLHVGTLDAMDPEAWPELRLRPSVLVKAKPPQGEAPRIDLHDVSFAIQGTTILRDLSLALDPGLHALTGPNGAGKTTLLRLMAGLLTPTRGRVQLNGSQPTGRTLARLVSLQFEEPSWAFFASTVREELAFTPHNQGLDGCAVQARVREATADFDLDAFLGRHPLTLSGGERERVALASLQAAQTPIVLLDEPTQSLDAPGRDLVLSFLRRLAQDHCVVAATHDEELIRTATAVHRLESGRLQALHEVTPRIPS